MRIRDEVGVADDELTALVRSTRALAAMAPRGAEDLFLRLFALRASRQSQPGELLTPTGRLRRWAGELAGACASALRPYALAVARGLDPGSLDALSRLPPEVLEMGEWPVIEDLAIRLEHLAEADPALVAWTELWRLWRQGGGGADSYRMPGVLEATGWGMEPDPRLRSPTHPVVALFRLPRGLPGDRAPDPEAAAAMALAAPVLAATGLTRPPLPVWVRLVALSGVEARDAPRLEAHLAFRAATGMRPGPVRRHLSDLPPGRAERLWSVLGDLLAAGGSPTPEGAAALDRARSLLGVAQSEPPWEPEDDDEARPGPGLSLVPGGGGGERHRRGRGAVPGHVKEAFAEWVAGGCRGDRVVVGVIGTARPLHSVLRSVAACPDVLPGEARAVLGLGQGATYAEAARVVTRRVLEATLPAEEIDDLDSVQDARRFLGGIGPRQDRYDPDEPLGNLGWPVVIRGLLYRIDDEILIGMEGQPDLGWDEFDHSEARPVSPGVAAAERSRPRP
jgi:hypothetical protein